jgi:predicted DsbA family dithiol-disulfide isomerase
VIDAAAHAGLIYARDKIERQPNTLDCHRLIRWAGANAPAMKQRLMALYFSEGGDLTSRDVLVQAAVDCRLDGDDVRRRLGTDEDVAAVEAEATSAKEAGIDGVPCFILGGLLAVSGAHPPEYLAQAIERAAQEIAKRVAAE